MMALAVSLAPSCVKSKPADIMPVTGTWINLAWQDERNNYMNFRDEDKNTDPEMWADKMRELHEIGVDWIAFDQVANEGKAYYPSTIMPHHYPQGRLSPVEAILNTCDELGMHVYLSCGWAQNQLDDVGNMDVVRRQCEIMEELAALYGDRPSFEGWYLPIEDCLIPYLPDRSVEGINRLTAKAHEVTPGKKTMVAPWGIFGADLDNPKFGEQLAKIDVDIIAYQDEVGCVRERFPMRRMKRNFRKLGEIHKNLDLEFWVNIENFTWDRGTNNWYSTLIPAEFGRYLSQIVSASTCGAKKIMSFSVYALYDKPGGRHPLGQPQESARAYANYQKWLDGDPHWKLLESVFTGNYRNPAKGSKVSWGKELTDGRFGDEDPNAPEWARFQGNMDVTVDLGRSRNIKTIAPRFLNYSPDKVFFPKTLEVLISEDGTSWDSVYSGEGPCHTNDRWDCWTDIQYIALAQEPLARYVRVIGDNGSKWTSIECDEIIVEF